MKRVGNTFKNKEGYKITVIDYINAENCTIQFCDGTIIKNVPYRRLKYGNFKKPFSRIGEKYITNQGYEIEIIEYTSCRNCKVLINKHCLLENIVYVNIIKGEVHYPYHKSVLGIGYLGEKCEVIKNKAGKNIINIIWEKMLNRSYNIKFKEKYKTYKDIKVCDEWHNFQNFSKWFVENYIENFQLDKDILIKGNKIYSPETCCFVPQEINNLFTKSDSLRGDCPIGVIYKKKENRYIARLNKNREKEYLGSFNTPEEAFYAYKEAKEDYIKQKADEWKDQISSQTYEAMYNYKVEITD